MSTSTYNTRSYAAINKAEQIRMESSSGGVFYEIAKCVIESGGVVFGAAFDDSGQVFLRLVDKSEDLSELMRSKYVQSSMGDVYKKVKVALTQDRSVLFAGTPLPDLWLFILFGSFRRFL